LVFFFFWTTIKGCKLGFFMTVFGISAVSAIPAPTLVADREGRFSTASDTENLVAKSASANSSETENENKSSTDGTVQLSNEAKAVVRSLQARDEQVRAHEQAHLAASGGLATSGASYTYQKGPDGVNYAIGGEVSIDVSPGRTPEETIARAVTIRAAALAPADPSGQDRAVASAASQLEQQARTELLLKATSELQAKVSSTYQDTTLKKNAGDGTPDAIGKLVDITV
jgi:hypothetical protein